MNILTHRIMGEHILSLSPLSLSRWTVIAQMMFHNNRIHSTEVQTQRNSHDECRSWRPFISGELNNNLYNTNSGVKRLYRRNVRAYNTVYGFRKRLHIHMHSFHVSIIILRGLRHDFSYLFVCTFQNEWDRLQQCRSSVHCRMATEDGGTEKRPRCQWGSPVSSQWSTKYFIGFVELIRRWRLFCDGWTRDAASVHLVMLTRSRNKMALELCSHNGCNIMPQRETRSVHCCHWTIQI